MHTMPVDSEAKEIARLIGELKKTALEIHEKFRSVPAARRNTARILASIKMLELNFSDLLALDES